jgi:hypothetical protein
MKRAALAGCITLASGLILAACLPPFSIPTKIRLSSPTLAQNQGPSPEFTTRPSSTLNIEASSTPALLPTGTFTPIPSLTSTIGDAGNTPYLGLTPTLDITGTVSPFGITAVLITDTATPAGSDLGLHAIYSPVHIQNKSRTQVDLSLHCTTSKGVQIILEYNNLRNVVVLLPQGNYIYVVYVGGRQSVGSFSHFTARKLSITIYQDSVVIQ